MLAVFGNRWAFSPLWLTRCKKIRSALPLALARMLNEKVPKEPYISAFSSAVSSRLRRGVHDFRFLLGGQRPHVFQRLQHTLVEGRKALRLHKLTE